MTTGVSFSTVEAGEQEPLLPPSTNAAQVKPKSLPKLQLAAVYTIKLLVPVASTQVMPYFNLMIQELLERSGIEHGNENVGYYSGLVVCSVSCSYCTVHPPTICRSSRLLPTSLSC